MSNQAWMNQPAENRQRSFCCQEAPSSPSSTGTIRIRPAYARNYFLDPLRHNWTSPVFLSTMYRKTRSKCHDGFNHDVSRAAAR